MNCAPLELEKLAAFEDRMSTVLNHAALALMLSIGHRTRLFDVMAKGTARTSNAIAKAAELDERYVREWLAAMVTGDIVEYDPEHRTYRLPPEHAARLTRSASPANMASSMQWIGVLGGVEDQVVDAFHHGKGVPYSAYHRFHPVMAEESGQTVVAGLLDHILPLVPDLVDRLEAGIDVLDVGCGSGQAMIHLAARFPRSRFAGFDFSEEAIRAARELAATRGVPNVRFDARDVSVVDPRWTWDLITAFDAIHDQARPAEVLRSIALGLRPKGVFLMQEIGGSSHLHHDCNHAFGTFLYTVSCMHCMSVSLAGGGPGLGAMWGKETALRMLTEAGFRDVNVEELPHDALNYYFVARR